MSAPGMITMWGGTDMNIPEGWLLCDGSTVNQNDYRALYKAVGNNFGANAPTGQFYLPDLRGRFVRGQDPAGTVDPDAKKRTDMQNNKQVVGPTVGSVQADAFQNHSHSWGLFPGPGTVNAIKDSSQGPCQSDTAEVYDPKYRTSSETRPVNAYLIYIIKY